MVQAIYVDGGTLVFADEKNVELNTNYMMVRNGGKLIIGSCDCPFTNKAILTFWGAKSDSSPDGFGTKGVRTSTMRPACVLFTVRSSVSILAAPC